MQRHLSPSRLLISLYNLHVTPADNILPLYVICDGKDAEGLVILGTSKGTSSCGEPDIQMFTASVKGKAVGKMLKKKKETCHFTWDLPNLLI